MKATFYPLTADEFLRLNSLLSNTQIRTYLYLVTKNPFPDSEMEIDTALISEQLGLCRRVVQRAIKQLEKLQLLQIQITRFKFKQCIHGISSRFGGNSEVVADETCDSTVASNDSTVASNDSTVASNDSTVADTHVESLRNKGFKAPQTIQTNSDLTDLSPNPLSNLSPEERERVLEFGRKKAASLPDPPQLPEAWVIKHSKEILKEYLASPEGRKAKQDAISAQFNFEDLPPPRRYDMMKGYENGGKGWIQADEAEREWRTAFVKHAKANKWFDEEFYDKFDKEFNEESYAS